ncbi:MAG: hypothetical protein HZB46_05850, partial [Solirubrobacterales bacterium]|nr:hypothetical protein [Solirubrobacterales bacterium]
ERARRRAPLVAGALAAVLVAGTAAAFVGGGGVTTPAPAPTGCNGHEELCAKRLDQVAMVATHNSMSAALPGWYAAMQEDGIPAQLRAGVRGLLIDTHYADRLPNGRLRTVLDTKIERSEEDGVSPEAVAAAKRIRDRLGFAGQGERGMYLCHSFCELGGTPLGEVLRQVHAFLVANPGEVLVVVNQDYVTPQDFVGAVRDAGLEELAYRGPVDGTWPTLGQMVARGQRVVFLAENEAGAAPWYHPAYAAITQETPYSFRRPAQLTDPEAWPSSCRENRGPDSAPLFLLNHWVTTDPWPKASDGQAVNAYAPLLGRARECGRLRDRVPNLVAINFYEEGDAFRVVDTLNGVGG